MGASVGAVDSVGAVVTGGIAARVPRTPASMVAWVSGVGLDAPMVGLSAAGELSGVPVPWTGTHAVNKMPLISNAYPTPSDKDLRNKGGRTRHVLMI